MKLTRNKIRKLHKQLKQSVKINKHHDRNSSSKYKSKPEYHIIKKKQNTFSRNKHNKSYKVYLTENESTHNTVQGHNSHNGLLSHILKRTLKTYIKPEHLKKIIKRNKKAYRNKYNKRNNRVRRNIQHGGEQVSIPGDIVLFDGDKPEQQIVIDSNPETDQRNIIEKLLNEIGPNLFQIKDSQSGQLITIEPGNNSVYKLSQILYGKYGESETTLEYYSKGSTIKYAASDLTPVSAHFVIDTDTPVTVVGAGNTVQGSSQPFINVTDNTGKTIEVSQKHLYKGTISKDIVNDLKGISLSGYRIRLRRVDKVSGEIQQNVQYILNLEPGNVVLVVKTAKTMFSELKKLLDNYSSEYKEKCIKIITDMLGALTEKGNVEVNKKIKDLLETQGGIQQFKTLVDGTGDTDMNNRFQELMALIEGTKEEAENCRLESDSKNKHLASMVLRFIEDENGKVVQTSEVNGGNMTTFVNDLKGINKQPVQETPVVQPVVQPVATAPPLESSLANAPPEANPPAAYPPASYPPEANPPAVYPPAAYPPAATAPPLEKPGAYPYTQGGTRINKMRNNKKRTLNKTRKLNKKRIVNRRAKL